MPPAATLPEPTSAATLIAAADEPDSNPSAKSEAQWINEQVQMLTGKTPAPLDAPTTAKVDPATAVPDPKAAAAAPDKPAAAAPEKKLIDAAEILKPGSKEYNWEELKKQVKEHKQAREQLEAQLADAKKRLGSIPEEAPTLIEQLRKERDDLSTRLEQASVERHPKFQQYFNSAFDRIKNSITEIVPGEQGKRLAEIVIENSTRANQAEVAEIYSTLSQMDQALLGGLMIKGRELHQEKQSELARAGERLKQLREAEESERRGQTEKLTKELESTILVLAQKDPLLQKREGDDQKEWNDQVEARLSQARSVLTGELTNDAAVNAALWSATGPMYRDLLNDQMAICANLREQIAALTKSTPGAAGGAVSVGGDAQARKPQTEKEWIDEAVAIATGKRRQ